MIMPVILPLNVGLRICLQQWYSTSFEIINIEVNFKYFYGVEAGEWRTIKVIKVRFYPNAC